MYSDRNWHDLVYFWEEKKTFVVVAGDLFSWNWNNKLLALPSTWWSGYWKLKFPYWRKTDWRRIKTVRYMQIMFLASRSTELSYSNRLRSKSTKRFYDWQSYMEAKHGRSRTWTPMVRGECVITRYCEGTLQRSRHSGSSQKRHSIPLRRASFYSAQASRMSFQACWRTTSLWSESEITTENWLRSWRLEDQIFKSISLVIFPFSSFHYRLCSTQNLKCWTTFWQKQRQTV